MSYFAPKELLPQLILPQLLIVASFLISLSACQHVAVNVENRSCENHSDCNGTQICGPLQNLCAHILETDCDTSSNLCPSTISTGYYCGETGTLLPCSDSATDCSAGCRTCQDDGTWSECLGAECELGEAWSCSSCEDNCANSVINATAVCDKSQNPHQCSYEGSCYSGSVDTDSNKVNGCECTVQFSGLEQCNGEDDDCDGIIDDNAPCGIKLECIEGECRCTNTSCDDAEFCSETTKVCEACTDSDNDHCGPSCSVCTDSFRPVCVEGECSCTVGSCSDGLYCEINSNSCASCTNADSNHCGPSCLQCSGTQPNCSNGACVCTST
ncbi:hypothetical protein KAI87_13665, partial [Myxococcota bacterium]|nr:hypothetical protein [Myxococcota bacterium]